MEKTCSNCKKAIKIASDEYQCNEENYDTVELSCFEANEKTKTQAEKTVDELEWFKTELLKGDKVLDYYQAQVDILTRAIKLLKLI